MFPRSTFYSPYHRLLGCAKFLAEFFVGNAAEGIPSPTLQNDCFGQFRVRVVLAPNKRLAPQRGIFPARPQFRILTARMVVASQKAFRMFASPVIVTVIVMTFKKLISVVFLGCSKKQMQGINATRIVASMTNTQIKRVGHVIDFVCDTVSKTGALRLVYLKVKRTITNGGFFTLPLPTAGGQHNNFRPKAVNVFTGKSGQDTMFNRHNLLLFSRLCLEGFSVS